jgi:hypothetical protein
MEKNDVRGVIELLYRNFLETEEYYEKDLSALPVFR